MAKLKTITVYETEDGKQFKTLEEAEQHELKLIMIDELDGEFYFEGSYKHDYPKDIADFIFANYNVTRK